MTRIREEEEVDIPIHPRQHAFQAGKSTESALHHLVGQIEKALDGGEYALGVFFNIQRAFDNTPITSIKKALHERQVIPVILVAVGRQKCSYMDQTKSFSTMF